MVEQCASPLRKEFVALHGRSRRHTQASIGSRNVRTVNNFAHCNQCVQVVRWRIDTARCAQDQSVARYLTRKTPAIQFAAHLGRTSEHKNCSARVDSVELHSKLLSIFNVFFSASSPLAGSPQTYRIDEYSSPETEKQVEAPTQRT